MKTTLMVRRKIEQILLIIQYNKQYIDCKESLKSYQSYSEHLECKKK